MQPLEFTNKSDADNRLSVDVDDGTWGEKPNSVCISVSGVQPVGDYNSVFECSFRMTREEAVQLRNWIIRYLNS